MVVYNEEKRQKAVWMALRQVEKNPDSLPKANSEQAGCRNQEAVGCIVTTDESIIPEKG